MSEFASALVSDKPYSELKQKLSLFGQFVGQWDFDWIYARGTPDESHTPGEWLFSWILQGTAIQDVFICPSREERASGSLPDGEYGTTTRFYNSDKDTWDIFYGGCGFVHVLEGKQVGAQIIVTNKDDSDGLNQWVFSDITPSSFHWQNRTSYDDGVSWRVGGELFAQRR